MNWFRKRSTLKRPTTRSRIKNCGEAKGKQRIRRHTTERKDSDPNMSDKCVQAEIPIVANSAVLNNYETIIRVTAFCLIFFSAVLNSGCTYHGDLRSDFYRPQTTLVEQKLPLRVALVKEFDDSVFQYRGNHSVEIQLSPGLIDASRKALEVLFETVEVIDTPLGKGASDLLAFVKFETRETYRNDFSGNVNFDTKLSLALKDRKSKTLVSSVQSSTPAAYSPSAEVWSASFLTGFSLFALSPITIPWTTNAVGRDAETLLEETLAKLLRTLMQRVASDDALTTYVSARQAGISFPRKAQQATPSRGPKTSGSGFVVSREGYIVTNHHVIEGCSQIDGTIQGQRETLTLVQTDPRNDLALLKMKTTPSATGTFRDGAKLRAGDSVVAVGYPLHGLLSSEANVTAGTISSLTGIGGDSSIVQITAPIQPGNSGGPLLDMNGNVIGIVVAQLNALKVGKMTGSLPQNVNFAVNSTTVRAFLDSMSVDYQSSKATWHLESADVADIGKTFTWLVECYE